MSLLAAMFFLIAYVLGADNMSQEFVAGAFIALSIATELSIVLNGIEKELKIRRMK